MEELKIQAEKVGITFYPVHKCGICNYLCGYDIIGDDIKYDSGCDCVHYTAIDERNWEDVTRCYNMNQPENNPDIKQSFLDKLNETWKFEEVK